MFGFLRVHRPTKKRRPKMQTRAEKTRQRKDTMYRLLDHDKFVEATKVAWQLGIRDSSALKMLYESKPRYEHGVLHPLSH